MATVHLNPQNNVLVLPMAFSSAVPAVGAGGLANRFGRQWPTAGNFGGTILAEAATGIFSTDEWGESYPSGTVWVKTRIGYASEGDSDTYWIPVPDTLPSGYTNSNLRNTLPMSYAFGGGLGHHGAHSLSSFVHTDPSGNHVADGPGYQVLLPVRTADGLYQPLSHTTGYLGRTYAWGPFATSNYGMQYLTNPSTTAKTYYTPLHAGSRAARLYVTCTAGTYAALGAGSTVVAGFDGSSFTIAKTDWALNGTSGLYEYSAIFPTPSLPAVGTLGQYAVTAQITSMAPGTYSGVVIYWRLSPRVDCPLPWFASTGAVCAPGGILTGGNVPGY